MMYSAVIIAILVALEVMRRIVDDAGRVSRQVFVEPGRIIAPSECFPPLHKASARRRTDRPRRNAEKIIAALDRKFQAGGAKGHIVMGSIKGLQIAELQRKKSGKNAVSLAADPQ
jgi:hypothetical protein